MKKKFLAGILLLVLLFCMTGFTQAALTTIGTAQFSGTVTSYNLIWDDNNNGNSIVWLDYSNTPADWSTQKSWASGLDSALTINLDGYTVDWENNSWRLPMTVDGYYIWGYDGSTTAGYTITSSEMGHLYYEELGNLGEYDTSGNPQSGYGLKNTGDFDNLVASWYWSGTEYASVQNNAWNFVMDYGIQNYFYKEVNAYGLAVRSGQVSAVPVPGAIWLFGTGLAGLSVLKKRKKGNCA